MIGTRSDLVDIACELRHETDKAFLIDAGDGKKIWVPKSMCEFADDGILTLPEWLAKDKGLL